MRAPIDEKLDGRHRFSAVLGLFVPALFAYGFLFTLVTAVDSGQLVPFQQQRRRAAVPTKVPTVLHAAGFVTYPLVASGDHRYLQDQSGQPFPILGRVAWDIPSLSLSDYQLFVDDTVAKGFNAILLNFLDRDGYNAPFDGNNQLPFIKKLDGTVWDGSMAAGVNPDYTTPNETYWQHIDGMLDYASQKGLLCLVFPSYVGQNGNLTAGWMQPMTSNGPTRMSAYGAFLANRYKTYGNLVWMLGGDYGSPPASFSAPELAVEQALLSGLKSVAGQQSVNFSADWAGDSIYTSQTDATLKAAGTLQGAYTWNSVSEWCRSGYAATPAMPAYLVEGPYDEEGPDGTDDNPGATQPVRRFQWWSVLSSIGGYVTGNGYVWKFMPGIWNNHLNTQGAQDMARLNAFVRSIAWYHLVPSGLNGMKTIITAGGSSVTASDYVAAAADPAGTLLVAYVPPDHTGTITVDMTVMGGAARARWFNPATAAYTLISSSLANTGTYTFTPPGDNGSWYTDWVLVLDPATSTHALR